MSKIQVTGTQSVVSVQQDAVIIRCGCGDPDSHNGTRCEHDEEETCAFCPRPCPTPRAVEDLGTHAYYHRNPLKRLYYRIVRRFNPFARF